MNKEVYKLSQERGENVKPKYHSDKTYPLYKCIILNQRLIDLGFTWFYLSSKS